jgi:hypothetical protein
MFSVCSSRVKRRVDLRFITRPYGADQPRPSAPAEREATHLMSLAPDLIATVTTAPARSRPKAQWTRW